MGSYYHLSLWASLKKTPEASAFVRRLTQDLIGPRTRFWRGACYYFDGGTTNHACQRDDDRAMDIATICHWKINHREAFEDLLREMAPLLIDHHDPVIGHLMNEACDVETIWFDDEERTIAILDAGELATARAKREGEPPPVDLAARVKQLELLASTLCAAWLEHQQGRPKDALVMLEPFAQLLEQLPTIRTVRPEHRAAIPDDVVEFAARMLDIGKVDSGT